MNQVLKPVEEMTAGEKLQLARDMNRSIEGQVVNLGVILLHIEKTQAWKEEYSSFMEFCQEELGRSKSFVTKLLVAARFLEEHRLAGETPSVEKLYLSIQAHPEGAPDTVLYAANKLTKSDLEEIIRENRVGEHTHTPKNDDRYAVCACGKFIKV